VQFMTAGSGIMHSEFNEGDKPLRFIQTWIKPSAYGLRPNYGSYAGVEGERRNRLQHIVSGLKDPSVRTPVKLNQDVDAFVSELDLGEKVTLDLPKGRMAYMLCIEGGVRLNDCEQLQKYDGAEITGNGGELTIEATDAEEVEGDHTAAHVLIFTMPSVPGAGRKDL